ncbi:MAG TPA: hypothetical protein VHT26_23860 [Trebonia sp.]|nr:hypothetical protein [Trebonia sp.]
MALLLPFTEADLKFVAGPRSYDRGLDYLSQVKHLEFDGQEITATVYGGDAYEVCLTVDADRGRDVVLVGDCSCPFGEEGNFCKHCVATGLAALKLAESRQAIPASHQQRDLLVTWLASLSKDELVAEILGLLDSDRDLRRRFELRAAARRAKVDQVRSAVKNLVETDSFIEYAEARDYARDVSRAAEAIDALIDGGVAEDAVYLARDALDWVTVAYGSADDSSGSIGTAAHELLAVHLRACQAAPPDPVDLGEYLSDLIIGDDYGLAPDLQDYTDLLGDAGTTAIREYVAAVCEAKPELWNVRNLMESLLKTEGDVDALVVFYSAHLDDRGQQHLTIARVLDEAGRQDDALDWAERGIRGAARPDGGLIDYVVTRYTAAGRQGDVLALRRSVFLAERSLVNYRALRQAATDTGTWPVERPKALAELAKDAKIRPAWSWNSAVLIDALLDDGDLDAAWIAADSGATQDQRIRLADVSIAARPADALTVYLKAITPLTAQTGDKVYDQMARLLLSARACHEALGTPDEFRRYLAVLRASQKRKRNLMKILADSGL